MFSRPTQINVYRLFIALHLSGTSIAYEPEQAFSSEHAIQGGCARSGWASSGARRGPPAQTSGDVMKSPIKIVKREDMKVTHDVAISSTRTKRQRTTEVIVKSWIIEFRERRRADLNRLQNAVRSKEIEGVTCG